MPQEKPAAGPSSAFTVPSFSAIPVVSAVAAGPNEPLLSPTGEYIPVPADWVQTHSQLVAAKVIGTCMEPEIMEGDLAVIDISNHSPLDGQLVAALTEEGEMLLKRFHRVGGLPILMDNHGRTYSLDGAVIQGVVRHIMRSY